MRFKLKMLFICFLCSTALVSAQQVNLSFKSAPLKAVLTEISKQTGYNFFYSETTLSPYKTVTVEYKGATEPITTLLDKVFSGTNILYEVKGKQIALKTRSVEKKSDVKQQTNLVKGVVRDNNGEPLPGVAIEERNSGKWEISGADGSFQITAAPDATLYFSMLGMVSQEIKVDGRANIQIAMREDAQMLEDVVVTGYQTLSKERTTGSFDKLNSEVLAERPTTDISSALQGLVAGMNATEKGDGSVDFIIRGSSSLYANTAPLIVVDGFPIGGSFDSINPNDVESVTILKDAAAASIWGTRSANGVIVVTTKKGKKAKLNVNVQGFVRIGTTPDIDYITTQADSRTHVDNEIKALKNGWEPAGSYAPGFSNMYYNSLTFAEELFYANKYYGLSEQEMNSGLDKLRSINNREQLKKHLMRTPLVQQYNASISGGNEAIDNYFSIMYENNNEATIKRGYDRFMLNYNNNYRFNKYITASVSATLQKRSNETSGVTVGQFAELSPYEMLLNEDGSYATNLNTWNRHEVEQMNMKALPYSDVSYNMLQEVNNRSYKTDLTGYRVNFGINAKIIKGLDLDLKYQYENNISEYRYYDNEETFFVRNEINYWTPYNSATGEVGTPYFPKGGIIRSGKSSNSNQVFRGQFTYSNDFGKHQISALAGAEISEYLTNSTTNPTAYGYNEVSNTVPAPLFGSQDTAMTLLGYSMVPKDLNYVYYDRCDRYLSYFANAAYMYDKRYGVSFSVRSDGSNFVSDNPALRWAPMWSVGGKWNISRESFMENAANVDFLTLRLTYGLNGNAEKSTSPLTLISTSSDASTFSPVASIVSYGNPNLRWETTKSTNIGVDFSFFNNILSGKVDLYNRYSQDVIGEVTIPAAYGTTTQKFNTAEISNKGIEIELGFNHSVKSIGLGIRSVATFSYNKNRIEKLYQPNITCKDLVLPETFVEGKPVGSLFSYEFAGTEAGIPYVYGPERDKYSMNETSLRTGPGLGFMAYSGSIVSPYLFGWMNQFTWKGLSLNIFINGKFGGKFRTPTSGVPVVGMEKPFISSFINQLEEGDGITAPTWPNANETLAFRWNYYIPYLTNYIESASFIRLKEVSLSYQLPARVLKALNIQGAKVFVQSRDLGFLFRANSQKFDPEWLPGTIKPSASYTIGINLNF